MKIKTQEKIRLAELVGASAIMYTYACINKGDIYIDKELIEYMRQIDWVLFPYVINIPTTLYCDRLTDEYKELNNLEKEILSRTIYFMDEFNVNDPIGMYAMYVYMYRHGYLSVDKEFVYDTRMKDIANIGGIDVIRGKGVCRSISSLLTDLYREKGFTSSSIGVNANNAISHIEKLCDKKLEQPTREKTKKFVKVVSASTKILPVNNHLITTVTDGNKNFIFDPTNDGYLVKGKFNQLMLANDKNYHMTYHKSIFLINKLLGQVKADSVLDIDKQLKLPSVSYEEYKDIYLDTLRACKSNVSMFDDFYNENEDLYRQVNDISNSSGGIVSRMLGFHAIGDVVDDIMMASDKIEKKFLKTK